MRISRPCYDKYHRCPGWAGGGAKFAKRDLCPDNGYISVDYDSSLWKWRLHRCDKCSVVVLPYVTRWLDPAWLRWKIRM